MAALAFLFLCFLSADAISHRPAGSLRRNLDETPSALVQQACKATRYPDLCSSSISGIPPVGSSPKDVLDAAISVSASNLMKGQEMVQQVLDLTPLNLNRSISAFDCLQGLSHSAYRTQSAVDAIPHGKTKDARAWLSDAVGSQNGCSTGLIKYANDSSLVNETVSFLSYLTNLTSNALGMLVSYDLFGNETELWRPPSTERDGFWEPGTGSGIGQDLKFGFPSYLKPNVIVCKDGAGGCCWKVQDAVDAAPDNGTSRFVILIMAGVYDEIVRIPFEKRNVVFIGQGIGKTIITGNLSVSAGYSTFNTSTVGVSGDGFMATGITFQNTAGSDGKQAVAFRSDSDLSFIENCEFLGNQDTLYAHSLRQFYKLCRIIGNVDFIFGNAAAYFQDCKILVKPRYLKPEKGEKNVITAQSKFDPSQSTGFVFQNCLINGTEEYMQSYDPKLHQNFLGRPWREYARTVYINSHLESLITPAGWMPWDGDVGLKTLYYGEFNNSGPGSNTSQRVNWSSLIPPEHVDNYSVQRFIQGDEWIPRSS